MEIEVHEGGCLVTGECRPKHALVKAGEKGLPADATSLREDGHFCEGLGYHTEKEVMAKLYRPGQLTLTHVGRARTQQVQVWLGRFECAARPRDGQGQPAHAGHLWVPH